MGLTDELCGFGEFKLRWTFFGSVEDNVTVVSYSGVFSFGKSLSSYQLGFYRARLTVRFHHDVITAGGVRREID